jgi:hypothetical protein
MRLRAKPAIQLLALFVAPSLTLSCKELPTDAWTTELPTGSVQLLVSPARNAEFSARVSGLPRRNEMVTPSRFVVRSQEEWTVLWGKLRATSPLPPVDFDTEMVIGEAIGMVAPPWEDVAIAGVMENAGTMYVLVLRNGSNVECIPAAKQRSDGSPVALTLVPKRAGTPVYLERFVPMPEC